MSLTILTVTAAAALLLLAEELLIFNNDLKWEFLGRKAKAAVVVVNNLASLIFMTKP